MKGVTDDRRTTETDEKGRIYLGTEYADKQGLSPWLTVNPTARTRTN